MFSAVVMAIEAARRLLASAKSLEIPVVGQIGAVIQAGTDLWDSIQQGKTVVTDDMGVPLSVDEFNEKYAAYQAQIAQVSANTSARIDARHS